MNYDLLDRSDIAGVVAQAGGQSGIAVRELQFRRDQRAELRARTGVDEGRIAELVEGTGRDRIADNVEAATEVVERVGHRLRGAEVRWIDGGDAGVADCATAVT
ncbi:MAG: hypothetical protein HY699_14535 [Deltaproteobacteria bacterium]|nr:hypothetical protein [Deltaproteobacteria bacterium]